MDVLARFWMDLVGRLTGPLTMRLYLQPMMATFYGVRDGLRDAREGRPLYFWTLVSQPAERRHLMAEGWKSIGKVFVLAIALDLIYQFLVFRWVYPFETLDVALVLAVIPYALVRGLVNRVARHWLHPHLHPPARSA